MEYTVESLLYDVEFDMCCESFDAAMEAKDGKGVFQSLAELVAGFVKRVWSFIKEHLPKGGKSEVVVNVDEKAGVIDLMDDAIKEIESDSDESSEELKTKVGPFKAIANSVRNLKNGSFDNTTLGKLLAAMAKAVKDTWEKIKVSKVANVFAKAKNLFMSVIKSFKTVINSIRVKNLQKSMAKDYDKAMNTDDAEKQNKRFSNIDKKADKINKINSK